MSLDLAAWQRRTPYDGSLTALTLCSSQRIDDPKLSELLPTYAFPQVLSGINAAKFESWWQIHGFDWQRQGKLAHDDSDAKSATQ